MDIYYVYFPRFLPRVCQAVDLDGNLTTDALLLDLPCLCGHHQCYQVFSATYWKVFLADISAAGKCTLQLYVHMRKLRSLDPYCTLIFQLSDPYSNNFLALGCIFYQNSTLQFSVIFFVRCWKTNVQCARFSIFVDLNHVEHRDET